MNNEKFTGTDNPQVKEIPQPDPIDDEQEIKDAPQAEKVDVPLEVPDDYQTIKASRSEEIQSCLRGYDTQAGMYRLYYNGLNQYRKKDIHYFPVQEKYDSYPLYRNPKMVNLLLNKGLNKVAPKNHEDWRSDKLYRLKMPEQPPSQFGNVVPIIDGKPDPPQENKKPVKGLGENPKKQIPKKSLFSMP